MIVRQKVYDAARLVEALWDGNAPFHMAEIVRDAYRKSGLKKNAAYWEEIRVFLFTLECVSKDCRIIIEPD